MIIVTPPFSQQRAALAAIVESFTNALFGSLVSVAIALAPVEACAADQSADELVVQATIKQSGDFLAFGFGSVWMMHGSVLIRVKADDNSVTEIPLERARGPYRGMAVGEGAVWVPDTIGDRIYKIDPETNATLFTIDVKMLDAEGSIGIGEGSVWVMATEKQRAWLARYSAATGDEQARIEVPPSGMAVVVDFGSAWISGTHKNEVYRVDAATNTLVATIPASGWPRFITSGAGSIWVINQRNGVIERIDPETNTVIAAIAAGEKGDGGDIASGGGRIWATFFGVPIVEIDPATNEARRYAGWDFGDAITFGAGSIWISGGSLSRIAPPLP